MTNNTLQWQVKAIQDLEAILSNLSYKDFKQANPRRRMGKNGRRIHRSYNLSEKTLECLEMLNRVTKKHITAEDEEIIKGFLLPYRMVRTEYLINTNQRLQ